VSNLLVAASRREEPGAIAGAVVGENSVGLNSVLSIPGQSTPQKTCHRFSAFVGQDFHVGEATEVIDGDVGVLPADAAVAMLALARDAMAEPLNPAQLLDV